MAENPEIEIAGRKIGRDCPPYIVAELSANHQNSLDTALKVMDMAAQAGADAVKLQTYRADTITINVDSPDFQIVDGPWAGQSLFALYKDAAMPWEWHAPLFERGHQLGVHVFSSPFDFEAVAFLEQLMAPAFKIASFEAVDHPLIERVASTGKPLIISTGMADLEEITAAKKAAERGGATGVALLHCISGYPTPIAEANLRTIADLAVRFPGTVIGLSDHTLGTIAASTAVALGASIIEKHVTLSRDDGGPDAGFSLEPDEFRQLVVDCHAAWEALGAPDYGLKSSERGNARFRRSLYVVADIEAGDILTSENVKSIRPGFGLPPTRLPDVLGCRAARPLKRGEALSDDMIASC